MSKRNIEMKGEAKRKENKTLTEDEKKVISGVNWNISNFRHD